MKYTCHQDKVDFAPKLMQAKDYQINYLYLKLLTIRDYQT